MFNYSGDLGQYPFFSMLDISNKFPLSRNIVLSTNAVSKIGNKGVFILTNDAVGFISKSIFRLYEFNKLWLRPNLETETLENRLIIRGFDVVESDFIIDRRKSFKEEWGNKYESYGSFFIHYTDIFLEFSTKEKAEYLKERIHFQIGIHQGEKNLKEV